MPITAILSCIEYTVTVEGKLVLLDETLHVAGSHTRFALERPLDLNATPGIWWLVKLDTSHGRVPASHIEQAIRWCADRFGGNFKPYTNELADPPTKPPCGAMDHQRWTAVFVHDTPMTAEELAAGWHYCLDFDGLLVGPGMPEMESCTCPLALCTRKPKFV